VYGGRSLERRSVGAWRSWLKDQLERADVQRVIAALLEDKVPSVRYMTILAVASEKHVKELEQLTQCGDRQVC